jgi:hypothetical protein
MAGIVEGHRWLQDRLRFLQGLLDDDPPADQRQAIEVEMAALREELRSTRWGLLRWFRLPHHPPDR